MRLIKNVYVLFAFLAFPLAGMATNSCIKIYSMSSKVNFDSRLETTFKQIMLLSASNQDHPSVVANFILQKTDKVLNAVTDFNDKTRSSDLKEKTPSFALLEQSNARMEAVLNDIHSISTKRFSFKTKGMKVRSIGEKMKEFEQLKSKFVNIRDRANEEMLQMMQEINKIKFQQGLIANENEFINKLVQKLMDEGELSVAPILLRKSVNLVGLETILQNKISTLDKHIKTMDMMIDSSEKLKVIGLSALIETTPKLQSLMVLLKKNEEARLAAIESARLEEIKRAQEHELRMKQASNEQREKIQNLDANLRNVINLAKMSPYSDARNKMLREFSEKNSDILSIDQAIQLASTATFNDPRNAILSNSYKAHYTRWSVVNVIQLVRAMTYNDSRNSTLKHFATNNNSRLSVDELMMLANAATYNDTKTQILKLASQK